MRFSRRVAGLGLLALGGCSEPPVERLTVSRETTLIVEPLRKDGTPDYALWFNRRYGAGVTPENNAALPLLGAKLLGEPQDVLAAMGLDPASPPERLGLLEKIYHKDFHRQRSHALRSRWRDDEAPLVVEWLKANERLRGRVAEIVRDRPRYWVPMRSDFALDTESPSLVEWRTLGQLGWTAALRGGSGHQAAHRELATSLRLAALLDQGPTVIHRLVAVGLHVGGAETVVALANPPSSRAAARSLLEEIERMPPPPPFADAVENDRISAVAGFVELYRAAAQSKEAWEVRTKKLARSVGDMAAGLGVTYSSRWPMVPRWAVDWDELLRFAGRCRMEPVCYGELKAAHADLSRPELAWLIWAARRDPAARRRIARALSVDEPWGFGDVPFVSRDPQYTLVWNELQARLRVARVAAAVAVRWTEEGRYPRDAAALGAGLAAPNAGYVFAYSAVADGKSFTFTAVPERPKVTGHRGFCADGSGRLAQSPDGTPPVADGGRCAPQPR